MRIPFFDKLNYRHYINKCFRFDKKKYVNFSSTLQKEGKDHLLAQIALHTHIIEKGLSMPEMRTGFGQTKLHNLIIFCYTWSKLYDKKNPFYTQAVQTILEYYELHNRLQYTFDEPFRSELNCFVQENHDFNASRQPVIEGTQSYFSKKEEPFPVFARSRHSLRCFSDEDVPLQSLMDAIELAQSAPSACNRQSTRVHIITQKTEINKILSIQEGNRGFGHQTNKLLIVTFYTPNYVSIKERNLGYIDSGIFTMNLLYSLHYHRIGACTLNWCDSPGDDAKLRSVINIDEKETVSLLIACGMVPERSFSVAKSLRMKAEYITTIHK